MKLPPSCRKARRSPQVFLDCLRQFLTPQAWKQAQQHCSKKRRSIRWSLHAVVLPLLILSWCSGDSLGERFETARAFYVASYSKRRQPGKTYSGFQKALTRLPLAALRSLAAGVRGRLELLFGDCWQYRGFVPIGCDGSRLACPRSAELEQRLGQAGKDESAPMLWVTALVHLRTGLLYAWRLGKGTASELVHLKHLIGVLPRLALVVADAAYLDYGLYHALMEAQRFFLVRMSSRAYLYSDQECPLDRFREGLVYYWPEKMRDRGLPALHLRLLRLRGRQHDVWLLTNVLTRQQLSRATASRLYRWRWRNEGLFRIYKCTLKKMKLWGQTVRQVHREAEGSLLAVQLLLAQGMQAVRQGGGEEVLCSPRQVLVAMREEIKRIIGQNLGPRQWQNYQRRLERARVERRRRRSPKERRPWPRRKPHKEPKPPRIHVLTPNLKARIQKELNAA
jgi:Transposase DDE domain